MKIFLFFWIILIMFSGGVFAEPNIQTDSDSQVNIGDGYYNRSDSDSYSYTDQGDDYSVYYQTSTISNTSIIGDNTGNDNLFDTTFPKVPDMSSWGVPQGFSSSFMKIPSGLSQIEIPEFPMVVPGSASVNTLQASNGISTNAIESPTLEQPQNNVLSSPIDELGEPNTTSHEQDDISLPIPDENYEYTSWFNQKRGEVYMHFLMTVVSTTYPEYAGCDKSILNCGDIFLDQNTRSLIGKFPSGKAIQICGNELLFTDKEGNVTDEPVRTLDDWFPIVLFIDSIQPSFPKLNITLNPPTNLNVPQINISDFIKPQLGWVGLENTCNPKEIGSNFVVESSEPANKQTVVDDDDAQNQTSKILTNNSTDSTTKPETDVLCNDCSQTPSESDKAELRFVGFKDSYNIGETLKIELKETIPLSPSQEVDLWVAIQAPDQNIWFVTNEPYKPFIKADSITFEGAKPYKTSISTASEKRLSLDIDLLSGMEGMYQFYAVYTFSGTHISSLLLNQYSNLATVEIEVLNH